MVYLIFKILIAFYCLNWIKRWWNCFWGSVIYGLLNLLSKSIVSKGKGELKLIRHSQGFFPLKTCLNGRKNTIIHTNLNSTKAKPINFFNVMNLFSSKQSRVFPKSYVGNRKRDRPGKKIVWKFQHWVFGTKNNWENLKLREPILSNRYTQEGDDCIFRTQLYFQDYYHSISTQTIFSGKSNLWVVNYFITLLSSFYNYENFPNYSHQEINSEWKYHCWKFEILSSSLLLVSIHKKNWE